MIIQNVKYLIAQQKCSHFQNTMLKRKINSRSKNKKLETAKIRITTINKDTSRIKKPKIFTQVVFIFRESRQKQRKTNKIICLKFFCILRFY